MSKNDAWEVTIAKDGIIETIVFPPEGIKKDMLFRFQYHYKVPIHWFWNPTMAPGYKSPPVN